MNDTNTMANISLGSAIGLIVLFFVSFCLGMIPFVGMLNLLIYPLEWLLVFVAIGTGTMGLIQASKLDGVGRPQALMGVTIPILWGAVPGRGDHGRHRPARVPGRDGEHVVQLG